MLSVMGLSIKLAIQLWVLKCPRDLSILVDSTVKFPGHVSEASS